MRDERRRSVRVSHLLLDEGDGAGAGGEGRRAPSRGWSETLNVEDTIDARSGAGAPGGVEIGRPVDHAVSTLCGGPGAERTWRVCVSPLVPELSSVAKE